MILDFFVASNALDFLAAKELFELVNQSVDQCDCEFVTIERASRGSMTNALLTEPHSRWLWTTGGP